MLAVNGHSYFLAEGDSAPSAFGQHWVNAIGSAHLGRIIVAPAAKRRGVGRTLCEQLFKEAVRCTGAGSVTLRVYRDNTTAVALYSSLGFEPSDVESDAKVLFMRARASPPLQPTGAYPQR